MKNGIRIVFVSLVLIGGVAGFAYWSIDRFNDSIDTLRDTCYAIASQPPVMDCVETSGDEPPATIPEEVVPEIPQTPTDLILSFAFPQKDSELYIGCSYQVSFESSGTIGLLTTSLLDAGTNKPIESAKSGLAEQNQVAPDAQGFDWNVGEVWPGAYYLNVTDANGVVLKGEDITIKNLPTGISDEEKTKICTPPV